MRTYKIEKNDSDQRIDKFIRKAVPKLSLPSIYKHIRKKNITVNDKKIDINYKLQLEDIVKIYLNDDITTKEKKATDFLSAKDILDVIYEDENIIVVNKPIGIVVQDDETKNPDTLNNRLLKYLHKKNE
jgi:23S rRNA pseudouridine955/2504/2580 synthase